MTLPSPPSPQANTSLDFVPIRQHPTSRAALVCFHFAGGSAQTFYRWREQVDGECDVFAVELPGRGRRTREPFATHVQELARHLAQRCTLLPDKPWIFFGHSLGALLAYETVRALAALNLPVPCHLFVSARQCPDWLPVCSGLPALDDRALHDYLASLDGTPDEVLASKEMMGLIIPTLRADLQLIYQHQHSPGPALDIPIDAIGAIDDDYVRYESLLGWQRSTRLEFRLRMIEGGHFALMDQPGPLFELVQRLPVFQESVV